MIEGVKKFLSRKIAVLALPFSILKAQLSVATSKAVTGNYIIVSQLNIRKIDFILIVSKTLDPTGIIEIGR